MTPEDYLVERSAFWGIQVTWWNMCAVSIGQTTTLKEVPFGGYRLVVGVNPSFWSHTSSAWQHKDIVTDLYAIVPLGGPPINAGSIQRSIYFYAQLKQYVMIITTVPNGNSAIWWRFPPASENAGSVLALPEIPNEFYTVPSPAGVLFPVPHC